MERYDLLHDFVGDIWQHIKYINEIEKLCNPKNGIWQKAFEALGITDPKEQKEKFPQIFTQTNDFLEKKRDGARRKAMDEIVDDRGYLKELWKTQPKVGPEFLPAKPLVPGQSSKWQLAFEEVLYWRKHGEPNGPEVPPHVMDNYIIFVTHIAPCFASGPWKRKEDIFCEVLFDEAVTPSDEAIALQFVANYMPYEEVKTARMEIHHAIVNREKLPAAQVKLLQLAGEVVPKESTVMDKPEDLPALWRSENLTKKSKGGRNKGFTKTLGSTVMRYVKYEKMVRDARENGKSRQWAHCFQNISKKKKDKDKLEAEKKRTAAAGAVHESEDSDIEEYLAALPFATVRRDSGSGSGSTEASTENRGSCEHLC